MQFMICIMMKILKLFKLHIVIKSKNACSVKLPPEDEQLAYSKHVEDVIRIKLNKVHIVGFVIRFITMHCQYNIKNKSYLTV